MADKIVHSENTLQKLYEELGFGDSANLVTKSEKIGKSYQRGLLQTIIEKLNIESIFFYEANNGSIVPYIYFSRLEGQNKAQLSKDLARLHKLTWNMGRAPLLIVALPDGVVKIYNTYSFPEEYDSDDYQTGLIESLNIYIETEKALKYHCQEFESGNYWRQNRSKFNPKNRADYTLLENLKIMRRGLIELLSDKLALDKASEIVHSLLGRSIFIKYLEDRKDSTGNNVFPIGYFGKDKNCFLDVLPDKEETYDLFEKLNEKFNGDLFPVGNDEYEYIKEPHLRKLKSFLSGEEHLPSGQLYLWKYYSFDVIPIEFISKIYEEFFHIHEIEKQRAREQKKITKSIEKGTHYTPHFLVEFLVDEVFPWNGKKTDFKTLDPACGSGVFLVEIYRRLIAHWEQANKGQKIQFRHLRDLLINNIFGVDLDSGAIRVTAFSLYLTLCDFLEPRQIWEKVAFPKLRDKNLFNTDFFEDNTNFAKGSYDLVIGNPPWKSELTEAADNYFKAREEDYPERQFAPDNQISIAFLWRAPELCKPTGEVCLLMPSKGLLFNRSTTYRVFRRDFFSTYHINSIINFSAFRHILFEKSVGPASAIYYTPQKPKENIPILYCSLKPLNTIEDRIQFLIHSTDIAHLSKSEVIENDVVWKVAMWGSPRDYELIKKLNSSSFQTFDEKCTENNWTHGEGVTVGNKKNDASEYLGKPFVDASKLNRFLVDESILPPFEIPKLENLRNKTKAIFKGPHILLKQSPKAGEIGLRAALLNKDAIFKHSLIGISGSMKDRDLLSAYCILLNSSIILYYALMTSRRWLVERDELEKDEIMKFPIPTKIPEHLISFNLLQKLASSQNWEQELNSLANKLYNLTEEEQILIDDAINYTLEAFRLRAKSKAFESTFDKDSDDENILLAYMSVVQRTLQNSFGSKFEPVIFQQQSSINPLPLRAVALQLMENELSSNPEIKIIQSDEALDQALNKIDQYLLHQRLPNLFIQRNVRAYIKKTIYIIKPDQRIYWTRSNALRDADEIYTDIMKAWR